MFVFSVQKSLKSYKHFWCYSWWNMQFGQDLMYEDTYSWQDRWITLPSNSMTLCVCWLDFERQIAVCQINDHTKLGIGFKERLRRTWLTFICCGRVDCSVDCACCHSPHQTELRLLPDWHDCPCTYQCKHSWLHKMSKRYLRKDHHLYSWIAMNFNMFSFASTSEAQTDIFCHCFILF